jgi:hypothetical protein
MFLCILSSIFFIVYRSNWAIIIWFLFRLFACFSLGGSISLFVLKQYRYVELRTPHTYQVDLFRLIPHVFCVESFLVLLEYGILAYLHVILPLLEEERKTANGQLPVEYGTLARLNKIRSILQKLKKQRKMATGQLLVWLLGSSFLSFIACLAVSIAQICAKRASLWILIAVCF